MDKTRISAPRRSRFRIPSDPIRNPQRWGFLILESYILGGVRLIHGGWGCFVCNRATPEIWHGKLGHKGNWHPFRIGYAWTYVSSISWTDCTYIDELSILLPEFYRPEYHDERFCVFNNLLGALLASPRPSRLTPTTTRASCCANTASPTSTSCPPLRVCPEA